MQFNLAPSGSAVVPEVVVPLSLLTNVGENEQDGDIIESKKLTIFHIHY